MYGAAKNIWLNLITVALVAFANVALKVRVTALGGDPSASWFSYILSLALDPWVWSGSSLQLVPGYFMLFPCGNLSIDARA